MRGFLPLFKLGLNRRLKDSFIISYGIMFPVVLILLLGYLGHEYYGGVEGVSSYYYYTIVTLPYCTLLSSITLIYVAREEARAKCGSRFIIAPVDNVSIVLSKIIPSAIAVGAYNIITMVASKLVFNMNYKGHFIEVYLLLLTLGFMSCALGTFIGLCSKNFFVVKNFVSIPIMVLALLGGAFFPVGNVGWISPLNWINRGIFSIINDNTDSIFFISLIIIVVIGIVFTSLSIKKMKKEAFL